MELLDDHDLTLFLSDKVGKASQKPDSLKQLEFFEQSLFLDLLYPLVPRQKRLLLSFEELANVHGCEVTTLNSPNSGADFQRYENSQPDLVVSIRYGVILKDPVISLPKHGIINLHSGILPGYKGVMATFRAMLNEEKLIGTTLHYITDSSIDQGPVVGKTQFPVDRQKSYLWHVLRLYPEGCRLIARTVDSIEQGGRVVTTAQMAAGKYYTFPTKDELRSFEELGFRLFDGEEIAEFIREYLQSTNEENINQEAKR
jgi:methionyl-tRNA formyltransferase